MAPPDQSVADAEKALAEPPPSPVEVELEGDEEIVVEGAPAVPAAAAPPKPQSRRDSRVQNALQAAADAEARAAAAEHRAQEADARAAKATTDAAVATKSGMENYAARVKSDADAAEAELEKALEGGDKAEIAKAQRKISKLAAAEADVEAWQASVQAEPPPAPPEKPAEQPQQQPQIILPSDATREFFEASPWFHPFQLDDRGVPLLDRTGRQVKNPDFDEDLHDAAMLIHKRIQRDVKRGVLAKDYVESPEYFAEITDGMKAQFPDAFGEEAAPAPPVRRTPPMAPARQPVAPASRGAPPAKPGSQKVTLSGEEAAMCRAMVDSQAVRYPHTYKDVAKRGQVMSYDDAYKDYARRKGEVPQAPIN